MHGTSRRDRGTSTYVCSRARSSTEDRCGCWRCEASSLEATVWSEVGSLLTNPQRLLLLAETALDIRPDVERSEQDGPAAVGQRIRRLENGLGSTVADLVRRGMDLAVVSAATAELEQELALLRQRKATLDAWQRASQDKIDRLQRLSELAQRAEQVLRDPSPELQRRILDLLDVQVRILEWR